MPLDGKACIKEDGALKITSKRAGAEMEMGTTKIKAMECFPGGGCVK